MSPALIPTQKSPCEPSSSAQDGTMLSSSISSVTCDSPAHAGEGTHRAREEGAERVRCHSGALQPWCDRMRLLVTRPEPDGERTAASLRARGREVTLAPLL